MDDKDFAEIDLKELYKQLDSNKNGLTQSQAEQKLKNSVQILLPAHAVNLK